MCCPVAEFCITSREFPAAVFVNPRAGGGRGRRCLTPIRRIFAERSFPADFIFTESTESLESQARAARNGRRRDTAGTGQCSTRPRSCARDFAHGQRERFCYSAGVAEESHCCRSGDSVGQAALGGRALRAYRR